MSIWRSLRGFWLRVSRVTVVEIDGKPLDKDAADRVLNEVSASFDDLSMHMHKFHQRVGQAVDRERGRQS